ncbi:hypothetical protein DLREEDagr8_35000 [Dongia sp. agr-C8]
MILAAATLLALCGGAAHGDEGREIDCNKTNLKFEAPGFTANCRDYSDSSISVGEMNAASQVYSLFAVSEADITYIQAYRKAVLGGTRIYFHRRSLESELEDSFSSRFSDWGDEDDIGDFEVKHVTITSESGEPADCVGFLKLGARRYEGVSSLTAGYACSGSGRGKALEAVQHFVSQQN